MGRRGPPPTPTAILQMRGSSLVPQREGELSFPVSAPSCPTWLNAEAKAEWKRQVKHLESAGVIAEVDRAALAAYCEAWGEFRDLCAEVQKLAASDGGYTVAINRGLVNAKAKAVERLLRLAGQFGFTPAARTRIKAPEQQEPKRDGVSRFFAN